MKTKTPFLLRSFVTLTFLSALPWSLKAADEEKEPGYPKLPAAVAVNVPTYKIQQQKWELIEEPTKEKNFVKVILRRKFNGKSWIQEHLEKLRGSETELLDITMSTDADGEKPIKITAKNVWIMSWSLSSPEKGEDGKSFVWEKIKLSADELKASRLKP